MVCVIVMYFHVKQIAKLIIFFFHKIGGCPVMVGSKWITNKWIRSNSNMFTRKCPKYTTRELRKFRNIHKYSRGGKFQDP